MLRTRHSLPTNFCVGLLLFFSFLHFAGQAQEKPQEALPLTTVIKELEQQFDIKFSYINSDMESLTSAVPDNLVSLEDILAFLRQSMQLKIERLNERYYTITKRTLVTVCARVLDNFAENTVTGATVEVLGTELAQTTDSDGKLVLNDIPRDASLKIRFLGYTTKYVPVEDLIQENQCPKILLGQKYQQLNEVIVYKFLTTGITKEKDASITINTEDFGILPGLIEPDVLQTVQALPGIKSIDETVSDINIRGGTNDQNFIIWNGIKMYQSGHFFGLISAFNPYLTDEVTVYKNGTPSRYGDGVSGVIQMETNDEISDFFSGGAGFNLISGDVYAQVPIKKSLALQFSARRSITDFLNTPTYDRFFDRAFQDSEVIDENNVRLDQAFERQENFFFYDFTGKLLYDVNDYHKIRLNFISINNDLDFEETNLDTNETTNSLLQQTNLSFGGQWTAEWTDRLSSHLNIYLSKYNLDAQNISSNQIQQLFQRNTVEERAIKLNTEYIISESFSWDNGFQYIETGVTNESDVTAPQFQSEITEIVRSYAPYSQISYHSLENKFIATVGLRGNYFVNPPTFGSSFEKLVLEPRLNLNFKVANYLRAQILGEFKSQTNNQVIDLEQNFLGVEKRRWISSNGEELPITESKQGSVGVNYEKNDFYFGLEGFYKEVEGISTSTQGFQNQNQFNGEIGSYQIRGFELLLNKRGANYSTWLSYTYNKNDYTFETIVPNSFPNNLDIRHTLTFAGTYTYDRFKFGLGINYRTGRPFTEPLEGDEALDTSGFLTQINFQEPNSSRLPEYFRADASAVYQFNISPRIKGNTGISVLNLTNRRNRLNTYYSITDDDQIETVENVSLGITPNLSFRVSF